MSTDDVYSRDVWADLVAGEEALTPNQVRKLACVRREGRQPDLSTVHRWMTTGGRPVGGGDRIILEHFQQGGRRSTRSAVFRFLRALSGASDTPRRPNAAAAANAHRDAERRLAAAGI